MKLIAGQVFICPDFVIIRRVTYEALGRAFL